MRITLDRTTQTLVAELAQHMSLEPPLPDPEEVTGYRYAELVRDHYEWDQTRRSWALLIGVRCVTLALEQWPTYPTGPEVP